MESVSFKVPVPVADVVRGEASRRCTRPGEVLADFFRRCWPSYVAAELERDLQPVLDVEEDDGRFDAERPRLTTGADSNIMTGCTVAPRIPGDLHIEVDRNATT